MAVSRRYSDVLWPWWPPWRGCERSAAPSFKAIDITGAEYAQGFDLPDADGQRRTLADFKGKVTLVFFGYTQCPDVCPTTLLEIAEVQARRWAPTASGSRASSSPSTPSATRPRC